MAMVRRHLWISGTVQGVGFRVGAAEQARALGLAGWVRNLSDGRVEAVVEGPEADVERFVRWCHHGPQAARVTAMRVAEEAPTGVQGFRIAP